MDINAIKNRLTQLESTSTTTTISKSGDIFSQSGVINKDTLKYFL